MLKNLSGLIKNCTHTHHNFQSSLLDGQINGAKIASAVLFSILVGGIKQSITYKKSSDFGCTELQSNVC